MRCLQFHRLPVGFTGQMSDPSRGTKKPWCALAKKKDVTDDAIKAVYHHFLYRAQESPDGAFGIRCDNGPWLRIKLPKEEDIATD